MVEVRHVRGHRLEIGWVERLLGLDSLFYRQELDELFKVWYTVSMVNFNHQFNTQPTWTQGV